MKQFNQHIYFLERLAFENGRHFYKESDDGTLLTRRSRTKIYEEDLPEWYIKGTYYRCAGYLSAKGITDLMYSPNLCFNHFLRDDFLYISYGGKILVGDINEPPYERFTGYDERVYGPIIVDILKAAREYSGYDISGIVRQIQDKREWLREKFPEDFEHEAKNFNMAVILALPVENHHPPRFYKITLDDYHVPAIVSATKDYYGTLEDIEDFINSLDVERHKDTVEAFRSYMNGDRDATHVVAYQTVRIVQPVKLIKTGYVMEADLAWDFKNTWGFIYKMRAKSLYAPTCVVQDGTDYILCCKPRFSELEYKPEGDAHPWDQVTHFWGHPGVLKSTSGYLGKDETHSSLYFADMVYNNVKEAVAALNEKKLVFDSFCQDIFGDG